MTQNVTELVTLNHKQTAAALALARGATIKAAANAAGVSARQVYRWLNNAAFAGALMQVRRDAISAAGARIAEYSGDALDVLAEVMRDTTAGAAVRVQAARVILDAGFRWVVQVDMEQRLQRLEQWLDG